MSYLKQARKQQRKQMQQQQKVSGRRASSAYSCGGNGNGIMLVGIVLLLTYLASSGQFSAFVGG